LQFGDDYYSIGLGQERILREDMMTHGHKVMTLGIYAPNEDENTLMKDQLFEKLNEIIGKVGEKR
jgi:hypothetical protein